ncbi:MAG TPA: DUF4350 domain-containing protein [Myxococcota bacterium]|nr:DUF4350 domain-containing protein [Myxococcota bacterium]
MSESSPRRRLIGRLALLGVAVAVFFATCEPQRVDLPRGYVGEAARNHYYAAQQLLERMGMPARSFSDVGALASLPPETSTLVIPTARRAVDPATSQRLLEWVALGGHLMVVTWQLWDDPNRSPDPILDAVGVRQYLNQPDSSGADPDAGPDADPDSGGFEPQPGPDERGDAEALEVPVARVDFPDRETPLEARFDPRFRFELSDKAAAGVVLEIFDVNGAHLVTVRHGKGLITGLTDDYFLTQPSIGELDHAELVYRMSRLGGHRGPVWFVYGDQHPSVSRLVFRHAWMVAASALALLALWLWSASRRFGPIAPDPVPARRELMEHVRAAGRLQWRRGGAGALLASVRESLLARMRERHPGFQSLTPSEQAGRLESLSGVPRARVADALAFGPEAEPSRFTAKIAILEKLRRSL